MDAAISHMVDAFGRAPDVHSRVQTGPGETAFTRIFGAYSFARFLVT
jgi:hypothetical protein